MIRTVPINIPTTNNPAARRTEGIAIAYSFGKKYLLIGCPTSRKVCQKFKYLCKNLSGGILEHDYKPGQGPTLYSIEISQSMPIEEEIQETYHSVSSLKL